MSPGRQLTPALGNNGIDLGAREVTVSTRDGQTTQHEGVGGFIAGALSGRCVCNQGRQCRLAPCGIGPRA